MQVEVYERELDAVEAAAAEAAARIATGGEGAAVALPAGRRARPVLGAIAAHGEIPWASTRWFVTDEVCGDAAAPDSARELVMSLVLAPNRAPASTLSVPDRAVAPDEAARAWEAAIGPVADAAGGLAAVVLVVGPDGAVAGLTAGAPAAGRVVCGPGGRVSIGADTLAAARAVVVVATGPDVATVVHEALTTPPDPATRPLQRVLPEEGRVTWFVDRAAVAGLLATASVVDG